MTDTLPSMTVVTPSYNQAQYLEEAIESVLSQNYPNLEYMVLDGGSTDGSVDVIRRHADRLAHWVSERDGGQSHAINKGFARATGDIVTFLNSDDFYFPGALRRVGEAFAKHPDAGIVMGYGRFVAEDGTPLRRIGGPFDAKRMIDGVFATVPQPAVFLRRSVIEKIGGLDTTLHFALDGELFWRAFSNFDYVFVPEDLAALRLQPLSKSVSSGAGFAPEIRRIAEKVIENPAAYPRFDLEPRRMRAAAEMNSARFLYNNGQPGAAVAALFRSLKLSRRYAGTIVIRELPRLVARAVIGKRMYERIGFSRSRGT
jgi:glycosyltransferase involved in cell wall biosynthesis